MSTEDNTTIKPDNSQNANQTVDKSKRSFAKVGMVAPVIMTLTSKAALGSSYYCTISGQQSGNTSSHGVDIPCGVGYSPGGWWQNASKTNGDGNIKQWCYANVNPFSIRYNSGPKTKEIRFNGAWVPATNGSADQLLDVYTWIKKAFGANASATTFVSIFGNGDATPVWDVLNATHGGLKWQAISAYLNASLNQSTKTIDGTFNPYKGQFNPAYAEITTAYIVSVYNNTSYTDAQKEAYFSSIHH